MRVTGTSYPWAALIMARMPHLPLNIFSDTKMICTLNGVSLYPRARLYSFVSQGMLDEVIMCLPGSRTPVSWPSLANMATACSGTVTDVRVLRSSCSYA